VAILSLTIVAAMAVGIWFARRRSERVVGSPQLVMSGLVQGAASIDPLGLVIASSETLTIRTDQVIIEKVWVDSCQRPGLGRTPAARCDRQPFFERSLVKAVLQGVNCVPEQRREESISFALEINHKTRTTRLFAGKSGSLTRTKVKPVLECIQQSLASADWEQIPHEHSRYVIGVLAKYPVQKRD
jgi:hypothetical protein